MPRAIPVEQKEREQSGSLSRCGLKKKQLKNDLHRAAILKIKEMLEPLKDRSSLEAEIWNNLSEFDEFSGSLVSVNVCSSKDVPGSVIPSHLHWCLITAIHQVLSKFDICNSAWVVLLPWQTGKCVLQPLRALSQWPMAKYFVTLQYLSKAAKIWLLGVLFVLVLL